MLRWKSSLKPTDGGGGGGGGSAPVYDAYADGAVNNGSSIPSFNLNIGSGGNAAVIVSVRSEPGGSGVTPAADITVTVGGTSATFISGATGTGFASNHLFGIAMGSATGNQAVVVSWTSGNAYNHAVASSFTGVDQTTPFDNGTGQAVAYAATSDTLAITSATGDLTFSDFGEKGGVYETITVNNTQQYNLLGGDGRAVGSTAAGAASVNHTATITTQSGGAAHVGCNIKAVSGGGGGGSFLFTEKFEGSESDNQGTSGYDNTGWTTVVSQASNVANPNYTPALADAASYQLKQQSTAPYTDDSAVNSFTASANIYMYFIWKMPYMSAVFDAKIKIQDASGNQLVAIGPHYDTLQLKDDGTNTATWSSSAPAKDDELHFWIDRISGTSIELRYSSNATRPSSAGLTISSPSGSADAAKIFLKTGHSLGWGVYDNLIIDTSSIGSNPLEGGGSTFPSTSLVAFYKLDESSGDALDSSGNSRTFTETGTVASTTGTIGGETVNVRTLDRPAGEYFSRTDDADFDVGDGEDFTIAFWAKLSSSMGDYTAGGIFSKRHAVSASDAGYSIALSRFPSQPTRIRYNEVSDGTSEVGDTNSNTSVAQDAWGHFMMVFTADSTLVTYVNNVQYNSVDASSVTGSLANSKDNYIGQLAYNNNGSIIADVTHLGFWKKALDSSERTALYNSGKVLAPAAPSGPAGDALILNGVTNNATGGVETSMRADGSSTVYGSYAIGNMDFRDATKNGSWTDDGLGCLWNQSTASTDWQTLLGTAGGTFSIYEEGTSTLIFSFAWTGEQNWTGNTHQYGQTTKDYTGTVPSSSTRIDVYHVKS